MSRSREALLERRELGAELGQRVLARPAGRPAKVKPQTWSRSSLARVAEVLDEAGQQVGLGDQHVDREADAELAVQLLEPARAAWPRAPGARSLPCCSRSWMLTVTSTPLSGRRGRDLLEQVEEAVPGRGVDVAVALLRRVAAGGVDQHRVVGEPPVAVARAADAAHRAWPSLSASGKCSPELTQRRGLARAGRADEHVPGQLVQVLATAEPRAPRARASAARCTASSKRCASTCASSALAEGACAQALQQRGVGAPALAGLPRQARDPRQRRSAPTPGRAIHTGSSGRESPIAISGPTNQTRAESASRPRVPSSGGLSSHWKKRFMVLGAATSSVISTRRFCARFAGVSLSATGSVSARPSARHALGLDGGREQRLTASARSCDRCQFDGKRSVRIGWLSVWPVISTGPGTGPAPAPMRSSSGCAGATTWRCRARTSRRRATSRRAVDLVAHRPGPALISAEEPRQPRRAAGCWRRRGGGAAA